MKIILFEEHQLGCLVQFVQLQGYVRDNTETTFRK